MATGARRAGDEAVRLATRDELAGLPEVERAADELFDALGMGPFPRPGTPDELAAALAVLVVGRPPAGFARVDRVDGGAHLEQLSVHPAHGRRGYGRALVRGACAWASAAGYRELTLATFRDVAWNAPFYASEGFVVCGIADAWYAARGLPPEDPELAACGTRVIMVRQLARSA
ncbi:MAG TPA: GNAT family N-acetyltransferase [Acidimicrobiales bacterium]|nr:GNAT family N-acetyltransferase [Acidimicrobiales bacterium]